MEHTRLTYDDIWNMPIEIRRWYVERKNKEIDSKKSPSQQTDPKPNVPSKKTFTPDGPAKGLV